MQIYKREVFPTVLHFQWFGREDSDQSRVCVCVCVCVCVLVAKLCLTLCDPMDCSLPGYRNSANGILQARILEWVAVSFSTRVGWGIIMRWWRFPLLTPIFCASRYHVPEANDGETWGSQDPPGAKEINHGGIQWPWGDFQLL